MSETLRVSEHPPALLALAGAFITRNPYGIPAGILRSGCWYPSRTAQEI